MDIFQKYDGSRFLKELPPDSSLFPLRARIMDLFRSLDGLEDPHFGRALDQDPEARLWEMMLATILRSEGYELSSAAQGPDFVIEASSKRVFVEAICPGPGDEGNPNSVAPVEPGARMAQLVPVGQIVLRIRGALEEKRKRYAQYLAKGTVSENDCCIIAVNASKIGRTSGLWPPAIFRATHGLGNPYAIFGQGEGVVSEGIEFRPSIPKANGQDIDTMFLLDEANRQISGVLYSECSVFSLDFDPFGRSMLIHNPKAQAPLPFGFTKLIEEIWTVSCAGGTGWRAYRVDNAR